MATLDEIRKTFPTAKYPPIPDCRYCHGTGIDAKKTALAQEMNKNPLYQKVGFQWALPKPCACIFIAPKHTEIVRNLLSDTVKKIRQEEGL
jgi:hypothetical protein